ncbi:Beige/BEACH domain containing protein [Trichomonas vaginalis G3]|uniref:Beige/BEACH domain containing protein n=1 Tax=Trichomonas vaginalis (strain ATCC PRA-98 / G3) TaxID=412133 RepID=A2FQD1_TRIV3|nr:beige/BEACH-related family [Trichomonas vaginalis G3]EAX92878.1 Beige/BEACH domain containing protein [Trichomonas vaginalis G3]KAI5494021.1 beige/BEACH-related family [Trichomonas vaginalis G3]|eukprot:XP_001305808.1 Beige/BEACH domain containing protein [Trichomonas vaginalis G3]
MELFSIFYSFADLMNTEVPKTNVILAVRKLFALGYFITQIPHTERQSYYREMRDLVDIVINERMQFPALQTVFSCSVGFCLTQIIPHIRICDSSSPETRDIFDLSIMAMKYYKILMTINDGSLPIFQTYILYLLLTFTDPSQFDKEHIELLGDIINVASKAIVIPENINFNYVALIDKLIWMLKTEIELLMPETKVLILVFLTKICARFSVGIDFMIDNQNIENVALFIIGYLKTLQFGGKTTPERKDPVATGSSVPSRSIILSTFDQEISIDDQELNKKYPKYTNPPRYPDSLMRYPTVNVLLTALTQFSKFNIEYISSFIQKMLDLTSENRTYEILMFLAAFVRSIILANIQGYKLQLEKVKIIEKLYNETSSIYIDDEIILFVVEIDIFMMKSLPKHHNCFSIALSLLEKCLTRLQNSQFLIDCLAFIAVTCPSKLKTVLQDNKYDLRIANLMFFLQNKHVEQINANASQEILENIKKCRLSLFTINEVFLNDNVLCSFFFESEPFVESIIQHFYEEKTSKFALKLIKKGLSNLERNSKIITTISSFFCQTIKNAIEDTKYREYARSIIDATNDATAAAVLTQKFVQLFINFVINTKEEKDLFAILKLAQNCAKLHGKFKEFFTSYELIQMIQPAVEEIANKGGKFKLIEKIWFIIFDAEILPPFLKNQQIEDKSDNITKSDTTSKSDNSPVKSDIVLKSDNQEYVIHNAEPLCLIFDLLRKSDKEECVEFLKFMRKTCEESTSSGLQTNNSSFTTVLVNFLCEYRNSEEIDELFTEASNLFTFLAQYSIKSVDLMMIFQNMTALPNGKKPILTNDFLNSLLIIFQSPFESPSSFFHIQDKGSCITIPNITISQPITSFLFMIDIALLGYTTKGKLLFMECQSSESIFSVNFHNNLLKCAYRDNTKADFFDFDIGIIPNMWSNLIICYNQSIFSVFMNGKMIGQHELKIKPFTEKFNSIPLCINIPANIGLCLLSQNLNYDQDFVRKLGHLPRQNNTSFDPCEKGDFPSEFEMLFNKEFSESLLFIMSASICSNEKIGNLSHLKEKSYISMRNGSTFGFYPTSSMVISAIGGSGVLIPFFSQLDMSSAKSEDFDTSFLPVLIKLLIAFLRENPENQKSFSNLKGFKMIGNLIFRASSRQLTLQVVELFKMLFFELTVEDLILSMILNIFLDVRMWIYADIKVHVYIYQVLNEIYDKASPNIRELLLKEANLPNKILFMIKTCYWCKPTPKLSLFASPKILKNSKEGEIHRPNDLEVVRVELWKLLQKMFADNFTEFNSLALIYFATDVDDIMLTYETLRFMVSMIQSQDQRLVDAIASHINFEAFFPLLLSEKEELHILCIHIFVKFSKLAPKYSELFLSPYTFGEWVDSILAVMNTNQNSVNLADNIFGYVFNLFDKEQEGKLKLKLIEIPNSDENDLEIDDVTFLAIGIMAITPFDDELAYVYLSRLNKGLKQKQQQLLKCPSLVTSLLFFLIAHCPNESIKFDKSCQVVLNILAGIYCSSDKNVLDEMIVLLDLLTERTQKEYTYISRAVLTETIRCSLNGEYSFASEKLLIDVLNTTFVYLFSISNSSKYAIVPYPEEVVNEDEKPLTFQELTQLKMSNDTITLNYSFGTRSLKKQIWKDADLADTFLSCIEGMPENISMNQIVFANAKSLFFLYGFVLANGLMHAPHFPMFSNHIRFLTNKIPTDGGLSSPQKQAFICYIAGLSHIYMRTDRNHVSHIYMTEDAEAFGITFKAVFNMKRRIQWGSSIDSFEGCFKSRGHHFAHQALEEFSKYESEMPLLIKEYEKNLSKTIQTVTGNFESISTNFERLNEIANSQNTKNKKLQVTMQMMQFSSTMRNEMNIGAKLYKQMIRTLSSENGPWNSPDSNQTTHYKLDDTFQRNFRRGKMIENTLYSDHKHASILRDTGNITNAVHLFTDHLKKLRIATFAGEEDIVFGDNDVLDEKIIQKGDSETDKGNILIKIDARLVAMKKVLSGSVVLTTDYLIFESDEKYIEIECKTIEAVYLRHYLLLDTSLEVYTSARRAIFLDFPGGKRKHFLDVLRKQKFAKKIFIQYNQSDINPLVKKATEMWCDGQLSNFDYLMKINIYSGRSYNDLSQYPVFPWILSDYSSEKLDLNSPASYRDLSKPIGVLDEERLEVMMERSKSTDDEENNYLYGSFYSSAAVVIGFLVRMEPFTSLHIELQSGRFDISDRLFHSIPRAWESVIHTTMDFRELIPEFFYLPDFLVNSNGFDLGKGSTINGDVLLPPWASSPSDFIRKNREALESPFATQGLPYWIDLIFGIKSRGKLAKECNNYFAPFFFTESITKEVMKDAAKFKFAQEFAACFGMAPQKVFDTLHPEIRQKSQKIDPPQTLQLLDSTMTSEIVCISAISKTIVAVTKDWGIIKLLPNETEEVGDIGSGLATGLKQEKPIVKISDYNMIIASEFDRAFSLVNPLTFERKVTTRKHIGKVTAVCVSQNYIATGDSESTVRLQEINSEKATFVPFHKSVIKALGISEDADILVCCSEDGFLSVTTLTTGRTSHIMKCDDGVPIYADITGSGCIVVIFENKENLIIRSFDINLNSINSCTVAGRFACADIFEWCHKATHAIISTKDGSLMIINVESAEVIWDIQKNVVNVTACAYREECQDIILGTAEGKIVSLPLVN